MKLRSLVAIAACALLLLASGCGGEPANAPAATTAPDSSGLSWSTDPATAPDTTTEAPTEEPTDTLAPTDSPAPSSDPTGTPPPTGSASAKATSTDSGDDTGSSTTELKAATVTGKVKVSGSLSLRQTADTTATAVTKLTNGSSVTILSVETDTTWLKVKTSSKTGYVVAKYISLGSSSYKVCTITGTSNLNVHNSASKTGKVLGVLKPGTTLLVYSSTTAGGTTWYKVKVGSSYGYIDSKYVRTATAS